MSPQAWTDKLVEEAKGRATEEAAAGYLTLWPSGAWPGTANINYLGNSDISNSFSVALSGTGTVSIASSQLSHFVLDIAGYVL